MTQQMTYTIIQLPNGIEQQTTTFQDGSTLVYLNGVLQTPGDYSIARKIETLPWTKWWAWHPVRVHGRRVWLKPVYRRCINTYVDMDDWTRYEYGTILDVLKST